MTRLPPVSLILPNRNNGPVLDLTLERLATNTTYPDFELIVVDDASTDESLAILRRWRDSGRFERFTLLETEHTGVSSSLNQGLARADGELVVSLDGDATIETRGWLERMVALKQLDPRVGAVTGGIVYDTGRIHAWGVHLICPEGFHDGGSEVEEPVGQRTLHVRKRHFRPPRDPRPEEVDAAIGCCLLVGRDLLDEVGGWDEGFSPVWFEDVDLTTSARRLGQKVFVLPEVEVIHRMSLRNSREEGLPAWRRGVTSVRRAGGRFTPQAVKDVVAYLRRYRPPPADFVARLEHHYDYWREKWGWDMLNPDLEEIRRRYGDTEIWWRYDDARRAAGEDILARYAAEVSGAPLAAPPARPAR